jgi:polyhydroxybutyrate depolymerase
LIKQLLVRGVAFLVSLWPRWPRRRQLCWRTINANGLERRYLLRASDLSANKKPLLLCFHGGAARVELLARRSGVSEAGQRQGFMVVFPEAKDGWIDSRPERGGSARDLDFIDTLIDSLLSRNQIDASRVFAFGISNGGLFVFRLACERPRRFAGFATALANMPVAALSAGSGPPVPIAMIFGRRDRVMPWAGGRILRLPELGVGGEVASAQATLRFWLKRNRAEQAPQLRHLVGAGRSIDVEDYAAASGGAPVRYMVGNWGHRWPLLGRASSASADTLNPADLITEFFSGLCLSDKYVNVRYGGGSA